MADELHQLHVIKGKADRRKHSLAREAVIIGSEFPTVSVKDLLKRSEEQVDIAAMPGAVQAIIDSPLEGPLIA